MQTMRTPETQAWIDRACAGEAVWDIGQIDAQTARALDKLVRRGLLLKLRGSFMGMSPLKTIWAMPGTTFPLIERVQVVSACGTIMQEATLTAGA